jgi:hypothetical protein
LEEGAGRQGPFEDKSLLKLAAAAPLEPGVVNPFKPQGEGGGGGYAGSLKKGTIGETIEKGLQKQPSQKIFGSENVRPSGSKDVDAIAKKAIDNIYSISEEFTARHSGTSVKPMSQQEWSQLKNQYSQPTTLPARAQERGFNPDMPLYKGGSVKYGGKGPPETGGRTKLMDPATKSYERGHFFAEDPGIAAEYGEGHVSQYVAAPKNPAVIDLGGKRYDSSKMHSIVEDARARGHDLLVIRNMKDIGDPGGGDILQNQIVVTDPSIVRSPSAKFDPDSFHLNDLLAGIVGALGIGAAAGGRREQEEKK